MTGRRYYLITQAAWLRHASRCAEAHFIAIDLPGSFATSASGSATREPGSSILGADLSAASNSSLPPSSVAAAILALITADEAAHVALESDAECEALPHPLSRTSVSERVAAALAPFGVAAGDDTFIVAEKLARVNPLLRHRVF